MKKKLKDNLTFTIDSNDKKFILKIKILVILLQKEHYQIPEDLKLLDIILKINGTPNKSDSFFITDNLGGVGDGRNIISMLDLQEDKYALREKEIFKTFFLI